MVPMLRGPRNSDEGREKKSALQRAMTCLLWFSILKRKMKRNGIR
jgi:hypothetical protein